MSTLLLHHAAAIATRHNLQGAVPTLLLYHVPAIVELLQDKKTVKKASRLPCLHQSQGPPKGGHRLHELIVGELCTMAKDKDKLAAQRPNTHWQIHK